MSYLTPSHILDILKGEGDLVAIVERHPFPYKEWVNDCAHILRQKYQDYLVECGYIYNEAILSGFTSRKQYVDFFSKPEYNKYYNVLFSMLDNKLDAVKKGLWELCRSYAENAEPFIIHGD
jgi:hypothetical protein